MSEKADALGGSLFGSMTQPRRAHLIVPDLGPEELTVSDTLLD